MVQLKEIIQLISPTDIIGVIDKSISSILPSDEFFSMTNESLSWLNKRNSEKISLFLSGILICDKECLLYNYSENITILIVAEPRKAFAKVLETFFKEPISNVGISKSSNIAADAQIGQNVTIGHYCVIENGCVIGNNVTIGSNNVIKRKTIIEDNVKIGSNNTIGDVGFGYEKDENGNYQRIQHIGNVYISSNVEISNNVCIDRAVLGSTFIGKNTKIDNLVHIAHGVKIGENTLIIANCMIAGSTKIGNNVWVSPSVSILNKLTIEDNSLIGMGSTVIRDISENSVVVGNPGRKIKENI